MEKLGTDECKRIMIEMLEEIDSFCIEHEITYYLTGGTLLGAIRHDGFIPWDDDIDIALLRDDYERLLKEFNSSSGDVAIIDFRNRKNYIWPSAKAINKKTVLIENGNKKAAIGVYLDVFPLDDVPSDLSIATKYVKRVNRWKKMLMLKHLNVTKERKIIKNIFVILAKCLYIIPDYLIISRIDTLSKKYNKKNNCGYVCNFAGAWGTKEIVKKHVFDKAIKHVFEYKEFPIPIGYHELLSGLYGDYMKLPPIEKRVTTHKPLVYKKTV